jgi:hypothetical protein
MQTKTCARCKTEQLVAGFHRATKNSDGFCGWCKACQKAQGKIRKATPEYRFGYYQANAKKKGYVFTLTLQDFQYFWNTDCGYCGEFINGVGFDRIDNDCGYTMGNVIPCCSKCNSMKSKLGLLEFVERCRLIAVRLDLGVNRGFDLSKAIACNE